MVADILYQHQTSSQGTRKSSGHKYSFEIAKPLGAQTRVKYRYPLVLRDTCTMPVCVLALILNQVIFP